MRHVVVIALLLISCIFWYPYLQAEIPVQKEIKDYSRSVVAEMESLLRWADGIYAGGGGEDAVHEKNEDVHHRGGGCFNKPHGRGGAYVVAPMHTLEGTNTTLVNVWKNLMASLSTYPLERVLPLPFVYGGFVIGNISGAEKSVMSDARFDAVCKLWLVAAYVPLRIRGGVMVTSSGKDGRDEEGNLPMALDVDVYLKVQVALRAEAPLTVQQVVVDSVTASSRAPGVGYDLSGDDGIYAQEVGLLIHQVNRDRLRLGLYLRHFLNDYILYLPLKMLWRRITDFVT